ncbi:MAG TPA: hypothetical protein VMZ91_09865 [Candidatus Paceibacterota bacterium]|nr:hypothetical protein [Candidatus Paceibacterota bacterium]
MSDYETEFKRDCPNCGRGIFYKEKRSMNDANKKNTFCKKCKKERLNLKNEEKNLYVRNCPDCDKELYYYTKSKLNRANKNNSNCNNCAIKIVVDKKKLSVTPEEKEKKKEKRRLAKKKYDDKYSLENKDIISKKKKLHSQKPEIRKKKKEYKKRYDENPENKKRAEDYRKRYNKRPEVRERKKLYQREKRKNIINKFSANMSNHIYYALKNKNISKNRIHYENLIINTIQEIIEHLEKNFSPDMTLANYGRKGWHIHHIVPLAFFEFTSPDDVEFKYCWSTDNLIPLWEEDNRNKGDKVTLWGKEYNARSLERDYFSKINKKVS